jgi:two-component system osmolarity sensor histidine kinase EnvZ
MLISVLAWYLVFTSYERDPRARQLSQLIVSVANLTRAAMIAARPEAYPNLLHELSTQGIHIYSAESEDKIASLPDRPFLHHVQELLHEELGPDTRMTLDLNGEQGIFVSFAIEGDSYWIALPRNHAERPFPTQWLGWGTVVLALALLGAWMVMFRVTLPLKALEYAVAQIGRGNHPAPLPETGPEEIRTLARNFNQMNADLARLDEDRALILAGISHDLRTPLTRMRMGIEMSIKNEAIRREITADIEEMDHSISQFLDFARADSGEPAEPVDLVALLAELASVYRQRGLSVLVVPDAIAPLLPLRPKAIRRAINNLITNALRYAADSPSIELALSTQSGMVHIEVRDRGPGIPPNEVERLKLPFTRMQAARTNAIGTGLGLAIVDRIARSHNGTLSLLPREGGGLIARISLPVPSRLLL